MTIQLYQPDPQGSPLNGQQALYLLSLMAQLTQAAQLGGVRPPMPVVVPGPGGFLTSPGGVPGAGATSAGTDSSSSADGTPSVARSGPAASIGTAPVPLVAGVEVPVVPAGVVDRDYWFADRSRSPIRSLRPWMRGPMRSAWSL